MISTRSIRTHDNTISKFLKQIMQPQSSSGITDFKHGIISFQRPAIKSSFTATMARGIERNAASTGEVQLCRPKAHCWSSCTQICACRYSIKLKSGVVVSFIGDVQFRELQVLNFGYDASAQGLYYELINKYNNPLSRQKLQKL